MLPDIIKVLTAMSKLAADDNHHPDSGLNRFPGTILAATYNERHAASNGGGSRFIAEVPATQHRASPLLEGLLREAVQQLRDERGRLFKAHRLGILGPSCLQKNVELSKDEVKAMLVRQLRAALEERGLDTTGKKADLQDRLLAHADADARVEPAVEPAQGVDEPEPDLAVLQERFKAELFGMIRIVSELRFHHEALLEEIAAGFMQNYHLSASGTSETSRDRDAEMVR